MKSKGLLIGCGVGLAFLIIIGIFFFWGVSQYNTLVTLDEGVKGAWSQVENQYQRRFDLIPNLVNTVKGYADFEKSVLIQVTEARASVGSMKLTPEMLNDPNAFQKFQKAQDGLGGALQRLMVITENYPQLKANENFLNLQSQLEGTENRISIERKRYNDVVQQYNTSIKRFPKNMIASMTGFTEKQYFKSAAGADKAPEVKF